MSAPPTGTPSTERRANSSRARGEAARSERDVQVARLRERVGELERELDRADAALRQRDAELEAVRCRYEAILEERTSGPESRSGLLSLLR